MTTSILETIRLETGPQPTVSIIWMHGLGADGQDFVPIVGQLNLSQCPAIRFIFPHAPTRPITINGGYVMRGWYDIVHPDLKQLEDEQGVRASQVAIEQLIAQEIEQGIPADRIILAGFSQGSAMALHTGIRYPKKLAGILALSGYIPLGEQVAVERSVANQAIPIFMAHGIDDLIVSMQRAKQSRDLLQGLHYAIEWHEYPMQHSVCFEEVRDIGHWLQRIIPALE